MSRERKWQQGELVTDILEVESIHHFWFMGRYYHPGWVLSWSYNYLNGIIKAKRLYTAVRRCPFREEGCSHGDRPICDKVEGGNPNPILKCRYDRDLP